VYAEPAPWIDKADLERAKLRNPPGRFQRLWYGRWTSGSGLALGEEELRWLFQLPGPRLSKRPGNVCVMGLDLGVKHDRAAMAVLEVDSQEGVIETLWLEWWEPTGPNQEIDLMQVEREVVAAARRYKVQAVYADPYQAALLLQRLRARGIRTKEVPFSGENLKRMASAFLQAVSGRVLRCYDSEDDRLKNDLAKLELVEKTYGWRLEAKRTKQGHADLATALLIALPEAMDYVELARFQWEDVVLFEEVPEPSQEEVEKMPPELREIVELETQEPEIDIPHWFGQ